MPSAIIRYTTLNFGMLELTILNTRHCCDNDCVFG